MLSCLYFPKSEIGGNLQEARTNLQLSLQKYYAWRPATHKSTCQAKTHVKWITESCSLGKVLKHCVLALHLVNQGDFTDWELSSGNGSQPRKIKPYPHPCPWRNGSEYDPEVSYQKTAWGWGGSGGTACRGARRQPSQCTVNAHNSRVWTRDMTRVNKQLRNIWKRSRLGGNSWKTFERK